MKGKENEKRSLYNLLQTSFRYFFHDYELFCSLLKIWNLNKLSGVIGVFNCQGAGSWPLKHANKEMASTLSSISGNMSPCDVEFIEEVAGENWNGDCAVYAFNSG